MRIHVPGDKSLTQRSLILAALADGESRLSGLLWGGDAASTAGALRALGARIPELPVRGGELRIQGTGLEALATPSGALDLGNSGTGTRLLLGVLAGVAGTAVLTGDDSLRRRPMARVTEPLEQMGARFRAMEADGRLPLEVRGRRPLEALEWSSPVASAQVKSALILAGVTGGAAVQVTEPRQSRDHTERLLSQMGTPVLGHAVAGGWRVELRNPPERLRPLDFDVPGDISSASFVLALAALGACTEPVVVDSVGLNRTRTAFLDVLERMGVALTIDEVDPEGPGEPVGSVAVGPSTLRATSVGEGEVPRLIDELPLVAILGARAQGVTEITGAAELRHKESDRIAVLVENLRALGVEVEEREDGLSVEGTARPLSGTVRTHGDHRIAMAFGVLGAQQGNEIEVDDPGAADVSFPGFWALLRTLSTGKRA